MSVHKKRQNHPQNIKMNNWKFSGPNFLWFVFFFVSLLRCWINTLKPVWVYFLSCLLRIFNFLVQNCGNNFPLWNRKTWIIFSRCAYEFNYCRSLRFVLLKTCFFVFLFLFLWLVLVGDDYFRRIFEYQLFFFSFRFLPFNFKFNFILSMHNRTPYSFHNLQVTKRNSFYFSCQLFYQTKWIKCLSIK